MMVATRCMNKNSILITVFGQNCLHIFTSYFLPSSPSLSPVFVYSFSPTEIQLYSSSAVPPLGLMNDLAGDGSCGCGGASGAQRGEETLFLSPPHYYSHSPGYTARNRMAPAYWIICWNDFLVLGRVCTQPENKLDLQPDLFISVSADEKQRYRSRRKGNSSHSPPHHHSNS